MIKILNIFKYPHSDYMKYMEDCHYRIDTLDTETQLIDMYFWVNLCYPKGVRRDGLSPWDEFFTANPDIDKDHHIISGDAVEIVGYNKNNLYLRWTNSISINELNLCYIEDTIKTTIETKIKGITCHFIRGVDECEPVAYDYEE